MEKRWVLKKKGEPEVVRHLMEVLNVNENIANLLVQRDITDYEQAKAFFRPQLTDLHNPFLMKDMDKAIRRIEQAIENNERILVYGDYDVDGTTAVSLVYSFFYAFYQNIDYYIPDRYSEGYGISFKGIDYAKSTDVKLVVALDCGIKANEQIEYANKFDIDFIIGDHHRPGEFLPEAVAVLDPKRADCKYPYKELSGCGIGFKLIQAYAQKKEIPFEQLDPALDLVAVSIASDIVPITGENRILAYYGLKLINSNPRPGLRAILSLSNIVHSNTKNENGLYFNRELNVNDMVFLVGPRINAAGRIESGKNAVELLVCDDYDKAVLLGDQINQCNNERRNLDSSATQEALELISQDTTIQDTLATVVYNPNWHKGVIGIVASRLTDTYYRPTIVLTQSNGLITGSARSIKEFDIYDAIEACSDLLEHFGGHKYAAGLSLKPENLQPFREKFERIVRQMIDHNKLVPEIEIDDQLNLKDINDKFFKILKQFAPFGPENMAPVFLTTGLVNTGYSRIVGNNHLKLSVVHPRISSLPFDGIAFQQGDKYPEIIKGRPFHVCYHIEENEWNGKVTLQLNVKDIKFEYEDEFPEEKGY